MTEQDLNELLAEHASAVGVPGAAIGVLRDGVETFACYGIANTRTRAPVTAESRFGVGSLTKSMVATVVALLAEDGRLSLDDPVVAHVPELRGAWAERATVRDLLANRSGLPLRAGLEFDFAAHEGGNDALSKFAARVAAEEPTSVAWSYTNAGWSVLGRVIETVTGSVWEEAMRRTLIGPTGMLETAFATEPGADARVLGHQLTPDGPVVPVEPLEARALGPAGTSMVSTVRDLLRFAALQLDDRALAALRQPQPAPRIHGWLDGWCLGWAHFDWEGSRVWGWDSVLPGERAVLRLVPQHHAAVVLMTNGETGRALYRSLVAELMHSLFGVGVPPLRIDARPGAAGDLSRYAGVYAWPDRRVEVTATRASLLISSEEGATEALPLDEHAFVVDPMDPDNPTVTFGAFDAAGRPHVLYVMLWGLPRLGVRR